jgi:hypothetical protein
MKNIRVFQFDPDFDPDPKIFVNTGPGQNFYTPLVTLTFLISTKITCFTSVVMIMTICVSIPQ